MQSEENYLRAIYHLKEENKEIRSVELADYLDISKASVSEMLRSLFEKGLIKDPRYKEVELTKKGLNQAINFTNKHRIIERFLQDILKISKNKIHEEAHKLEHTFSEESITKLNSLLNKPKSCPHGKPITRIM
tara:strand:+ start:54 stop:452 length:399 start_codon:yes stop_codon:yes gene_type:complete